jgi:pyruvate oxidase
MANSRYFYELASARFGFSWEKVQAVQAFHFKGGQGAKTGTGGFGQYMGEFNTAVKYGMDITHVLLNNSELGKVCKEQRAGEWPIWQTSLHNPSFAAYAKLCGGKGIRVNKAEQLDAALKEAIAHEGPSLVEVISDVELI